MAPTLTLNVAVEAGTTGKRNDVKSDPVALVCVAAMALSEITAITIHSATIKNRRVDEEVALRPKLLVTGFMCFPIATHGGGRCCSRRESLHEDCVSHMQPLFQLGEFRHSQSPAEAGGK
jgi:hypothetical protein